MVVYSKTHYFESAAITHEQLTLLAESKIDKQEKILLICYKPLNHLFITISISNNSFLISNLDKNTACNSNQSIKSLFIWV